METLAFEKHYQVKELVDLWGLDRHLITKWFEKEPGVIRVGAGRNSRFKQNRISLRIPASVAERVHRRLTS